MQYLLALSGHNPSGIRLLHSQMDLSWKKLKVGRHCWSAWNGEDGVGVFYLVDVWTIQVNKKVVAVGEEEKSPGHTRW